MTDTNDDQSARLDGNVAAGVLAEIFRCEPSGARVTCSGCGATAPIGALLAYGLELGAILRCPHCDTAIVRVAATPNALWLDVRGAVSLRFEMSG